MPWIVETSSRFFVFLFCFSTDTDAHTDQAVALYQTDARACWCPTFLDPRPRYMLRHHKRFGSVTCVCHLIVPPTLAAGGTGMILARNPKRFATLDWVSNVFCPWFAKQDISFTDLHKNEKRGVNKKLRNVDQVQLCKHRVG